MKKLSTLTQWLGACLLLLGSATAHAETVDPPTGDNICKLSELDLSTVTYYNDNGKNAVQADLATFGTPLIIRDVTYSTGVGTHAPSKFVVKVNGATSFNAILGIDDAAAVNSDGSLKTNEGVVDYTVTTYAADKTSAVAYSGTIQRSDAEGFSIADLDLTNAEYLVLDFAIGSNNWSDHVDVANAYFYYEGEKPELITEDEMFADASKIIDIPEAAEGLENIPLSSLDITKITNGWGTAQANKNIEGGNIILKGYTYTSGVGLNGPSLTIVKLNGSTTEFHAVLGIDDDAISAAQNYPTQYGIADYNVYLKAEDGSTKTIAQGTISALDEEAVQIDADVNGWKYLYLETTNGSDGQNGYDHVDWANAYLVFQDQNSTRPEIVSEAELTSKLACATTVFSQPGVRFMHKVRASSSDATVTVTGLPDGLTWNADRQVVEGKVETEGVYHYTANVTLDGETSTEGITFTVSSDLQLPLPFMGWLSWNSVQNEVSESIVQSIVELFEEKGLYECGWNTVMLDDWWHADSRASDGKPQPNATRFPNGMKAVADYVHNAGMKFGLYTDAATYTCAGAFGSYGSETIDAETYADWGIDIVKCDYCNAPSDVETAKTRYKTLADAFKAAGYGTRLYICEWGVREPWKWGAEVGGVCWRISQDVRDCWTGSGSGVGVVQSIRDMKNLSAYQGVNRFNDSDMLCTGLHATGKSSNDLCGSGPGMTQDEYRTQFALWCMWSSPMALSFDPRKGTLTDDDYDMITNKEMIAINQDRMGQQADLISEDNNLVIFAKDCENGDIALSVTNMASSSQTATFNFSEIPHLDAAATYTCRDIWEKKDLAEVSTGSFSTTVASHATKVFRLAKKSGDTAIGSPLSQEGFRIAPVAGKLNVTAPGTEGMSKRIIVNDTLGRIVSTLTTTKTTAEIAVPSGAYVVNVVCNAQATAKKVVL